MAFDKMQSGEEARTMLGMSPEQAVEFMAEAGCDVVALNCGTGIDLRLAVDIARRYRSAANLPIMAQPNAGLPVLENVKVLYKETPEEMARGLEELLAAGVAIVGGCEVDSRKHSKIPGGAGCRFFALIPVGGKET